MKRVVFVAGWLSVLTGCVGVGPPPQTVTSVDLERYAGRWFEIARYPTFFERGCVGVTATYTLREDGRVSVVNRCRQGALDGPVETIEGTARVVDAQSNAKLKVRFDGAPFEGDYWIIGLDENYRWALVGDPSRSFLWILAREPALEADTLSMILDLVVERGYDPQRLTWTPQPDEQSGD